MSKEISNNGMKNLLYHYELRGRGTGKTTSLMDSAWRLANEGKRVVVVSQHPSFSTALLSVFGKRYLAQQAEITALFLPPRFVGVDSFLAKPETYDVVLVDPDVWVGLLKETIPKERPTVSKTYSCGNAKGFDNVFDAINASHRRTEGKNFDPKLHLGGLDGKEHLRLGVMLRNIYIESNDEAVRTYAEVAYSLMYIAEMWPDTITAVCDSIDRAADKGHKYDVRPLVYEIIKQEKIRESGLN